MAKKELPEVNASSLADIAFLLLTFFLIATSMDKEEGIERMLPDPTNDHSTDVLKENVLRVLVNAYGQVMIGDEQVNVASIKDKVKAHINNNFDGTCDYCVNSRRDPNSSLNPSEAIVAFEQQKGTTYAMYLTVQNEVDKAYNELRDEYSRATYQVPFKKLDPVKDAEKIEDITEVKFKKKIAEAKPKEVN